MSRVKNDLYDYEGLSIYQYEDKFKFSLDSILLAEFVELKESTSLIVDFCTGNAPVPLILSTKTKAKIYGFELQKSIYDLGYLSVIENKLDNQIKIVNANLRDTFNYILPESVDIVTCNPPYFKYNKNSIININDEKAIARHEIATSLEDIMVSAKYILKNKGTLYIVHRTDRLQEIINYLSKYKFAVKKLQFIYSSYDKEAIMVLIKAVKNGQIGVKINPPLNVLEHKSYKKIFDKR
ncbi:MAG: tRNA1(Val) (adenine(37)-N6)-methyltransferase [Bacilli bacterium]